MNHLTPLKLYISGIDGFNKNASVAEWIRHLSSKEVFIQVQVLSDVLIMNETLEAILALFGVYFILRYVHYYTKRLYSHIKNYWSNRNHGNSNDLESNAKKD